VLVSRLGDELQGALNLQIGRLEGFGGQQFLFTVVEVAGLAINQAQFLEKVGFHHAVTALCDGRLQLAGGFGPVMSGGGDDTVVGQRTGAIQDAPLFLYLNIASHELVRLGEIRRPQGVRQGKERLAEVGINRDGLPPGRNRFCGLGLLLKTLAQQIPGHHVAGLQLDGLFEQAGGKRELALLLIDKGEEIMWLGHPWNQLARGFELRLCFGGAAQVVQNPTTIEMGDSGLRGKTDGFAGFHQGPGQIVTVSESKREIQVGRSQIGPQRHYLAQQGDSFAHLAHLRLGFSDRGERVGILRGQRDGFVEFLLGAGYFALLGKNQTEIQVAFLILRIVFEGLTKELLGSREVPLPGLDHGQIPAGFDELRLEVKRGLEPLLGGFHVAVL
jgi:hypothetical protein